MTDSKARMQRVATIAAGVLSNAGATVQPGWAVGLAEAVNAEIERREGERQQRDMVSRQFSKPTTLGECSVWGGLGGER